MRPIFICLRRVPVTKGRTDTTPRLDKRTQHQAQKTTTMAVPAKLEKCVTVEQLTARHRPRFAARGIRLVDWKKTCVNGTSCYIAIVDKMPPPRRSGTATYTLLCQGGCCEAFSHDSSGTCIRNRPNEQPLRSYCGLWFGTGDENVYYDHANCPDDALLIVGSTGDGADSLPLCITDPEANPALDVIEDTYCGHGHTGYYKLASDIPPDEYETAEGDDEQTAKRPADDTSEQQRKRRC